MNEGWYQDPSGRHELRFFDGSRWTAHVADGGTMSIDGEGLPPAVAGTSTLPPPMSDASTTQPAPAVTPFGSSPIVPPSGKKALWKRPWFLAAVAIAIVLGVAAALSASGGDSDEAAVDQPGGDEPSGEQVSEDEAPDTTAAPDTSVAPEGTEAPASTAAPQDTTATTTPEDEPGEEPSATTPPASGFPDAADGPFPVGTAVMEGGDLVRVNVVTPNAPGDDFFQPEPGSTLTTVEIEACGGEDGFNANAFYWQAFLDDNTAADNFIFADDFPTVGLQPGACMRGVVSYEVPDGRTLASVVMMGELFDEVARWTVDGAVPVTERLQPLIAMETTPVGSTAEFGAGHTAVVRSVTDAAPPIDDFFEPDPGRQFTRLDVELCAGTESLLVNPLYWLGSTTDAWLGAVGFSGSTLPAIDLAAGQCVAGLLELDVPAGSTTASVLLTDPISDEVARWSVG